MRNFVIFIKMASFLVIQTASIGDVILATPVIESIHASDPGHRIDFLLKRGCEGLFSGHPLLNDVLIWDKDQQKYKGLSKLKKDVAGRNYDVVINLHRFASSGCIAAFSGAAIRVGFDKNPFSFAYTRKVKHRIDVSQGIHETRRNLMLIEGIVPECIARPRLYPRPEDEEVVKPYLQGSFITISPASLWYTKQWQEDRWAELIQVLPRHYTVYLLGGPADVSLCGRLADVSDGNAEVLAGKLSLLQTAALMKSAVMNYTNDSAPMHLASAMNAPVAAVFCSTVPEFGFGPLSDCSYIIQAEEKLNCRPCGLHGQRSCPERHFKCSSSIQIQQLLQCLK